MKRLKLTKKTAVELIGRIFPGLHISKEETGPDVAIFRASTGPQGLEIRCENDWFNHNGRIELTILDDDDGNVIRMYFHPDTLDRDFVAEQSAKEDERREAGRDLVQMMGKELAHKLVDQCWEG